MRKVVSAQWKWGTHKAQPEHMIGDMPIAQPNTLTLLAFLNLAIERGAGRTEVVRRAIDVATYLGAVICCPPRRLPARSS